VIVLIGTKTDIVEYENKLKSRPRSFRA